jgi:bifunctional oligoribonuclease and PAP phosphatase NrnA
MLPRRGGPWHPCAVASAQPSVGPAILVAGEASEGARAEAARLLRRARKVVLTSHEKTDADGAGSALGLLLALRGLGIDAHAAFPSPLPENLRFLPGAPEAAVVEAGNPLPDALRGADCVLSLDAGAAARLGGLLPLARAASVFLNVDHHASNEGFGTHRWVDSTYAAVGTMAFEIVCELGLPLPRESCLCFYTALVFDTGGFAFSNTDPRSHRMAATCIERGVRPEEVTARLHRSRTLPSWRFEAEAAGRLRASEDGAVAWISVPRELFDRHGLEDGRQPDLVDVPVSLAATRIGVLLTELPGGAGVRVSLRSRCAVGVHTLAARHGGGGHPRAAGMTLPGSLADAERLVLGEVRRDLDAWSRNHGERGLPPQDA